MFGIVTVSNSYGYMPEEYQGVTQFLSTCLMLVLSLVMMKWLLLERADLKLADVGWALLNIILNALLLAIPAIIIFVLILVSYGAEAGNNVIHLSILSLVAGLFIHPFINIPLFLVLKSHKIHIVFFNGRFWSIYIPLIISTLPATLINFGFSAHMMEQYSQNAQVGSVVAPNLSLVYILSLSVINTLTSLWVYAVNVCAVERMGRTDSSSVQQRV